jgi:Na+/H+ antiporter NhaD/arsenite permease-like protein
MVYLSMASTLAGNLTIFGSIANIIDIELASSKVKINFLEYIKIGIYLTIITVTLLFIFIFHYFNLSKFLFFYFNIIQ